jgi:hypothetical protein
MHLDPNELVPPEDGDRIQSPKPRFHIKDSTIDNVQNCDTYINIKSTQTCIQH